MTTWNVRMSVVELIEAETAAEAVQIMHDGLRNAGFEPYGLDEPRNFQTFEADPDDQGTGLNRQSMMIPRYRRWEWS